MTGGWETRSWSSWPKSPPRLESRLMKRLRDKERTELVRMHKKMSKLIQTRSSNQPEHAIPRVSSKRKSGSGRSETSSLVTITRRGSSFNCPLMRSKRSSTIASKTTWAKMRWPGSTRFPGIWSQNSCVRRKENQRSYERGKRLRRTASGRLKLSRSPPTSCWTGR